MSGEWAATLTGSTMARFAPSSLASSAPASMAARSPETTTWPGALRLATTNVPWARGGGDELGQPGVVEADERGHRPVAALARRLHQLARARGRGGRRRRGTATPAATSAEYWPIEWPAAKAGCGAAEAGGGPALAQRLEDGDRRGEERRLGVLGQVQPLGRAVPGEAR